MKHNIKDRLEEINERAADNGVEWGEYVERNDGDEGWTPIVYSHDGDREGAEIRIENAGAGDDETFRRRKLVSRVVGPWVRAITDCYPENEVESLATGSVILSGGEALILTTDGTWVNKDEHVWDSWDVELPVMVLWEPTE